MKSKITEKTPRYPLRAAARRILRGQTGRAERIFHCHAAFLATLGLSATSLTTEPRTTDQGPRTTEH